jgi:hypothetical protein
MHDKGEIHRNQNHPVFYGTQQCVKVEHNTVDHSIQVKFDYGVFHIYLSRTIAFFLLENRDFLRLPDNN